MMNDGDDNSKEGRKEVMEMFMAKPTVVVSQTCNHLQMHQGLYIRIEYVQLSLCQSCLNKVV